MKIDTKTVLNACLDVSVGLAVAGGKMNEAARLAGIEVRRMKLLGLAGSGLAAGVVKDRDKTMGSEFTVMVTFEVLVICESFALNLKTYVPYVEKVA